MLLFHLQRVSPCPSPPAGDFSPFLSFVPSTNLLRKFFLMFFFSSFSCFSESGQEDPRLNSEMHQFLDRIFPKFLAGAWWKFRNLSFHLKSWIQHQASSNLTFQKALPTKSVYTPVNAFLMFSYTVQLYNCMLALY